MKKYLLTIGAMATIATPITAIISCSDNSKAPAITEEQGVDKKNESDDIEAISLKSDLDKFAKSGTVSTKQKTDFQSIFSVKKVEDEVTTAELGITEPQLSPGVTAKYTVQKVLNSDGYIHIAIELFLGTKKVTFNRKSMTIRWQVTEELVKDLDVARASLYKEMLEKLLVTWKTAMDDTGETDLYYYKFGDSIIPYFNQDEITLKANSDISNALKSFGFVKYPPRYVTDLDKGKVLKTFNAKVSNLFSIGYINNGKYYLGPYSYSVPPGAIAYSNVDDAVQVFMNNVTNIKHSKLLEVAIDWSDKVVNNQHIFKIATPDLSKISQEVNDLKNDIFNNIDSKMDAYLQSDAAINNTLVNKYIPGGQDGASNVSTQTKTKVVPGSDVIKGSSSSWGSFKLGGSYYLTYGLYVYGKKGRESQISQKPSWFKLDNLGTWMNQHTKQIAYIETKAKPRSKKMVYLYVQIDKKWFLLTDILRYLASQTGDTFVYRYDANYFGIGAENAVDRETIKPDAPTDLVTYIDRVLNKNSQN